ncbi:alanine racemase [Microbacterium yannicii]|uniref:alanine racemase n=1 Tax=Microbacterium yannicii TaxID=671622 RepID=UPI000302130B|nr:alanine racemase [Microbacterium yannicii]
MSARLHVDLGVLATNIAHVRATVAPATLMLVVKDDAYGHGLAPVVGTASAGGVTWFGAFDVATGLAVRAALSKAPGRRLHASAPEESRVFVWIAATADELADAVAARLDVGVGDPELLEELAAAAREAGAVARVHLKIDTGLHRNGVRPEDWPAFVARAAELEAAGVIDVAGVWSHIAEASDEEDDAARHQYERALQEAESVGLKPQVRHLAASAAAFARPEFRYDMVRVGAFCYGIRPAGGPSAAELGVGPVSRLEADVVAVDARGVTIELGSLDGVPSSLADRASVGTPAGPRRLREIGGRSVIDAWDGAAVGDQVTIYGPGSAGEGSATDLAELIGTIGEEIAVRVSPLVPRVYSGE